MATTKIVRKILRIDEEKCDGCGACVPACAEDALQIIEGKVKLVSEVYCDGLGACLGECPQGAITIEERAAEEFDEEATKLHLEDRNEGTQEATTGKVTSQLKQWPIQMHLISPTAPYYQGADVLLTADCVAYAMGSFHPDYLKEKSIAIACPKLDEGQDVYAEKIRSWLEDAKINTLTVLIMQVPCCIGLLNLAQQAAQSSKRTVPIKSVVVSLQGEILSEEWAST
jgi:ferredoxin